MSDQMPPRVSGAHQSDVGVYIGWAEDDTYCQARYLSWNVRITTDPFFVFDPNFRKAVEDEIYHRVVSGR